MSRFRDLSIKTKLVSIQLFTTSLILVFFVGFYLITQYQQFAEISANRMGSLAEILGSNSVSALRFFDNEAAGDVLSSLETQPDIMHATLYDSQGDVFAAYVKAGELPHQFSWTQKDSQAVDGGYFVLSRTVISDDETVGWISLRLDTSTRKAELTEVVWQSLFVLLGGLFLAYFLSLRAQKQISGSILTLAKTSKDVQESGDYSLRVKRTSQDEIGTLVDSFNEMMERIWQHEKHLEELVADRTAELTEAKLKAEESDHLKSAFLASMSHELRTPLNSIIGFTGILMQGMAGPLNDEQKKQLRMVQGSSKHLLELINDVLDISKIEAGRLQVYGEAFKIDLVVIMAVSSLRPFAEKKGLTLNYELDPSIPQIHSDKRRVEQILLNLINNAIKFTEEGSIRVKCFRQEDELLIQVIDTGMGIKEKDLDDIFSTFRQVDTGLNRVKEGSGLGLAICRRLSQLLGGSINVESEYGEGSTFTVALSLKLEALDEEA